MFKIISLVSIVSLAAANALASGSDQSSTVSEAPPLPACQCSVDVFQGAYGSQAQQANVHDLNRYSIYFKWKPLPGKQGCYQLSCDSSGIQGAINSGGTAVMSDLVNQLIAGDPVATSAIGQFGASHIQAVINTYIAAHSTTYSPSAPVCQAHLSADGRRLFVGQAHIAKYPAYNYHCRGIAASSH